MPEFIEVLSHAHSARELLEFYYGLKTYLRIYESDVSVGTTAVKLGTYANTRIAITLGNTGSALVVFGYNSGVTVTTGLPLPSNTGVGLNWLIDNELVMQDIYAISGSSGQTVHVVESVLSGL